MKLILQGQNDTKVSLVYLDTKVRKRDYKKKKENCRPISLINIDANIPKQNKYQGINLPRETKEL